MSGPRKPAYTVDDVAGGYEDLGPALSRAITAATKRVAEGSVYVRDRQGEIVGRVDRELDGTIKVVRR